MLANIGRHAFSAHSRSHKFCSAPFTTRRLAAPTLLNMHNYAVRPVTFADAVRVAEIYNPYVLDTAISFEESPVQTTEMATRIERLQESGLPWLVAEHDGHVAGYAYAAKWRERHAYRFSVECTVYVDGAFRGKGVGHALYESLFRELRQAGFHAVLAVIALPNNASVNLHEKFGMRKVAHFSQVGFKFGIWHDVGNWQITL